MLNENPLIVKQDILDEINRLHSIKGLASTPKTSFYGLIEQYMAAMHPGDRKELKWFVGKKIEVFDSYDLVAELILDLCRGNRLWQFLCETECLKISATEGSIKQSYFGVAIYDSMILLRSRDFSILSRDM